MITRTFWLIVSGIFLFSCINVNVGEETKKEPKQKKIRASYRSNRYHSSIRHYEKVDEVYTNNKKGKQSSAAKYKKQQAAALKNLNKNKKYTQPDSSFELY